MQTSQEIKSALNNVRYYIGKLRELIKLQFERDIDAGSLLGINTGAGSIRFDSLGAMQSATGWINIYCDNIEANLQAAEKQDNKLRPTEEEEQEPEYEEKAVTPDRKSVV